MKRYFLLFFLLFIGVCDQLIAQTRWIEDADMNFKVSVPQNYQTNKFKEGTDYVHAFVSPDQNVAIQIRSFKAPENATIEMIMQNFSQNRMKGSEQLISKTYTLNNLNGQLVGYKWKYNNINVNAGAFYTIQGGDAYIVWSLVPENLYSQRNAESYAITNSFTLINPPAGVSGGLGGLLGVITTPQIQQPAESQLPVVPPVVNVPDPPKQPVPVIQITDVALGVAMDSSYQIASPKKTFSPSAGRINLAYGYTGNAFGQKLDVKWYSDTHNTMVKEFTCSTPDAASGRGHAYIENPGKPWPEGKYRVQIVLNDQMLQEVMYTVVQEIPIKTFRDSVPEGYLFIVSEDACLEHMIPKSATIRKAEEGQKTWNVPEGTNGKILTMVMQNITKNDRDFNSYLTGLINGITSKGAVVTKKEFGTVRGLSTCRYWYDYNGTPFIYSAVDGPKSFYLLGFVGSADYREVLEKHHNTIHSSFRKTECGIPLVKTPPSPPPVTLPPPPPPPPPLPPAPEPQANNNTSTSAKEIILDNTNNGYDFATGKVRDGHQAPEPDVLNEPWCTPLPALCGNWAKTGKSKMEEVTSAPATGYISDGKSYTDCKECPLNEVLVFKLKNGTFAKMIIVKDENTKIGNGCQHKISCQIQYPAFK